MTEQGFDEDEIEIPIWVGGCEKWLTGLTRKTTCDDVIYALLAHNNNPNRGSDWDVQCFAVYECWRGVERPLSSRTKILKIWRTWGAEIRNVKFQLRKLDNILDSSSEISRTRRHRTRTKTKEEKRSKEKKQREKSRDSRSKYSSGLKDGHRLQPDHKYEKSQGHAYFSERPKHSKSRSKEKSKLFHRLVHLVIEQEKRIQEQLSRIQDLDSQIGKCETKIKEIESHKVSSSDAHAQDENGLFPKVKAQDMEAYLHMCESILDLEDKISKEQDRIEDLSVCIQEESTIECDESLDSATAGEYSISTGQCTYTTTSGVQHKNPNPPLPNRTQNHDNGRVNALKTELQRSISLSMAQQKQMHLVNRTLGECEKQLSKKREFINRLFIQLETIEEESENDLYDDSGNVDLPPFSAADNKDGRDSCDSGVQGDMLQDIDAVSPRSETAHAPQYTSLSSATSLPSVLPKPNRDSQIERGISCLPRLRKHMVPYKTYTAPTYTQPELYTSASSSTKSPPSDDSDTGLSSLHSDEPLPILETLV